MKLKVIAVYDAKLQAFGNPRFERMEGNAIRAFTDGVNQPDKDKNLYNHPEDYSLWLLAEYDDEKGTFDPLKPKNLIGAASVHRGFENKEK